MRPAPILAGALLALLGSAASAGETRRIVVESHSLFPAQGTADASPLPARAKAGDASSLKPTARKVPMPIELELVAEVDADGQVAFRCDGGPVRDFRARANQPATGGRR